MLAITNHTDRCKICLDNLPLFLFTFFASTACEILVPQSWIEPLPSTQKGWNLNHWITREVPLPL